MVETRSVPFDLSLKAVRINTGLTQEEFAEILHVTKSTICNWEQGKGEPTLSDLRRISEVTHIPIDFIRPEKSR